jgi:hypothetical protein
MDHLDQSNSNQRGLCKRWWPLVLGLERGDFCGLPWRTITGAYSLGVLMKLKQVLVKKQPGNYTDESSFSSQQCPCTFFEGCHLSGSSYENFERKSYLIHLTALISPHLTSFCFQYWKTISKVSDLEALIKQKLLFQNGSKWEALSF